MGPVLLVFLIASQSPPELAPNAACLSCHSGTATPMAGDSHRGSLMALASVDPFFRAAWEIAREDDATVGGLCASCHFPGAMLGGRMPTTFETERISDLDGIACDLCHRFTPPTNDDGAPVFGELMGNAGFTVGPSQPKLGPLGAESTVGHESAVGVLAGRSETCGQCHDVTDTLRTRQAAAGHPGGGPVPLERTFREWTQSVYARPGPDAVTCQGCHMPTSRGPASRNGTPERTLQSHRIVGSTTRTPHMIALMPDVLGDEAPPVTWGLLDETAETSAAALALLQSAAVLGAAPGSEGLALRVENRSGHKLPTGYSEGRRMWLEVARVAEDGACAALGGGWDAARCGLDEERPPLRVWEAVLGEAGEKSFHFALVDTLISDTRIPPRGFRPDGDTLPLTDAFPWLDEGTPEATLAHWDDVELPASLVDGGLAEGDVLEARVLFQSTTAEFLRFLVENAAEEGPRLAALFLAAGPYGPEVVQEKRFRVQGGSLVEAEGETRCLSALRGPPEVCLGLPVPDEPAPPPGGDGPAGDDPDDVGPDDPTTGGCRCVAGSGGTSAAGGVLAVLLAGSVRRRRR